MENQQLSSTPNKKRKKIWILFLVMIVLVWIPVYLYIVKGVDRSPLVFQEKCGSLSNELCGQSIWCSSIQVQMPCNEYGLCPLSFNSKCVSKW